MPDLHSHSYGMKLTNREIGYMDRLEQRCEILRARIKEGFSRHNYIIEWERELKAMEWAIARIEASTDATNCEGPK